MNGPLYEEGQDLRTNDLPVSASEELHPRLIAPSIEKFQELYLSLNAHYRDILVILTSSSLNPAFENATAGRRSGTGPGQGIGDRLANHFRGAGPAGSDRRRGDCAGQSAADVERMVRSLIPRIYMMICTPGLS